MVRAHSQQQLTELLRRGEEVFERDVRSKITDADPQSYLLIDINTGDFEVDADSDAASERLRERRPEALIYFRRVGSETVHRFGILSAPETAE
mgnify:FL=1